MRLTSLLTDQLSRTRAGVKSAIGTMLNNARPGNTSTLRKTVIGVKIATSPVFWWCVALLSALLLLVTMVMQITSTAGYASEKVRSLIPFVETDILSDISDEERYELALAAGEDPDEYADFDEQITSCIASSSGIGTIDPVLSAAGQLVPEGVSAELAYAWILYVASTPEPRAVLQREDPLLLDKGERQLTDEEVQAYAEAGALNVLMFPEFTQEFYRISGSVSFDADPVDIVQAIAPNASPENFLTQAPVVLWGLASQGVLADSVREEEFYRDEVMNIIDSCP